MRSAPALGLRLALLVLSCLGARASLASGIEQLKTFVGSSRTAQARFEQRVTAKGGTRVQSASGTMAFQRPGRFRWVYEKPYHQLIVGDGEKLWVYDQELNQVTVKRLDGALSATPAALLAGDNTFEKNFELSEGPAGEGLEWVEAVPRQPEAGFERLRLGFEGGLLRRMVLIDNFGQTTQLRFDGMQRNLSLAQDLFRFKPPSGADVVGE